MLIEYRNYLINTQLINYIHYHQYNSDDVKTCGAGYIELIFNKHSLCFREKDVDKLKVLKDEIFNLLTGQNYVSRTS